MLLRQELRVVGAGLAAGAVAAFLMARLVSAMLFHTTATDWPSYTAGGGLIVISAVLLYLPVEDLGFRFRFGVPDALLLLAATLPMSLIAPSIQMYLASFAKSFKEAQSYMGYLVFLPMLPGMVAAFYPIGDRPWMAPIPILGQYALSIDIIGGKPPSPMYLIAGAASAAIVSLIFVALTTRLFSKEKIIFGR